MVHGIIQLTKKVIDQFFREGIERMQGTEDIVTIGMRGDGDAAMSKKHQCETSGECSQESAQDY